MFQFIRAEVYARRASTNAKAKSEYSIDDIIGEALRDEGHIPHVGNPEAPRYLLGSEVETRAILGRVRENAAQYRDKMGRKMREDAAVLLAGVASFPRDAANRDPALYEKWETLTVDYLKRKYGADLRSVVMHNDEEHPHLHFYVYSDTEVNAKMLHDGYKNGSSPAAYKAGTKAFQDDYHEQVASRCGLARTGPKRRRLSRAEWHAEQEMAQAIAKAESACPEREKKVSTIGVGQRAPNQLAAVPNVLPRDRRGFGAIRVSALGNTFQVMQTRAGVEFGTTERCAVRQCFRNRFRDLRANQVQWDDAHCTLCTIQRTPFGGLVFKRCVHDRYGVPSAGPKPPKRPA